MADAEHIVLHDAQPGFVNLRVQMAGADYPKNALVYISDDYKVTDISAADKVSVGEVLDPATAADGYGTICSRFRRVLEDVTAGGVIAAGDLVKSTTDSGGGVQRVQKWTGGVDTANTIIGQALEAAAQAGDTIDVGLY